MAAPVAQLEGVIENDDAPFCEQNKNNSNKKKFDDALL